MGSNFANRTFVFFFLSPASSTVFSFALFLKLRDPNYIFFFLTISLKLHIRKIWIRRRKYGFTNSFSPTFKNYYNKCYMLFKKKLSSLTMKSSPLLIYPHLSTQSNQSSSVVSSY